VVPTNVRRWTCHVSILACLGLMSLNGCDFVKEQWYEKTGDCEGLGNHYALVSEDCQASCVEDNENRPVAMRECRNGCPKGFEQLKKVLECVEIAQQKQRQQQNNQQGAPNQNVPSAH
jgi:hypothetical protein